MKKPLVKSLKTLAYILGFFYLILWYRTPFSAIEMHNLVLWSYNGAIIQVALAHLTVKLSWLIWTYEEEVYDSRILGVSIDELSDFLLRNNGFPAEEAKGIKRDNGYSISNNIHSKLSKFLKNEVNCLWNNPRNQNKLELRQNYTKETLVRAIKNKENLFDIIRK